MCICSAAKLLARIKFLVRRMLNLLNVSTSPLSSILRFTIIIQVSFRAFLFLAAARQAGKWLRVWHPFDPFPEPLRCRTNKNQRHGVNRDTPLPDLSIALHSGSFCPLLHASNQIPILLLPCSSQPNLGLPFPSSPPPNVNPEVAHITFSPPTSLLPFFALHQTKPFCNLRATFLIYHRLLVSSYD